MTDERDSDKLLQLATELNQILLKEELEKMRGEARAGQRCLRRLIDTGIRN